MNTTFSTSKTLLFLLLFISTAVIFHSCVKEGEIPTYPVYMPFAEFQISTTNIRGLVVDENDLPISNCQVSLNVLGTFEVTTTDQNGNFNYHNVAVPRGGAFLKVYQTGKFEAFRKMNITGNSYNYTKIKLLDKNIIKVISATSGGKINHMSKAQLDLPANSVRDKNGNDYTGNINVAMSWIDPTSEDLASRMVGDLSGIDKDGKKVVLGTFGMLNVELLGDTGDLLQLKEGKTATLSFPIPTEILSQAPSNIPLWYYDEESEAWIEDGFATLQDDFYVGEVGHFSSWNVDTKGESIVVKGKIVKNTIEEDIQSYLQVFVSVDGIRQVGGFLDDSGEFEFYNFPLNSIFTLSVLDECDNVLFNETYLPLTDHTDLGTIVIDSEDNNNTFTLAIKGIGRDCNEGLLTNGYIEFELDGLRTTYSLEEDGVFEFTVTSCKGKSAIIELHDIFNKKTNGRTIDIDGTTTIIDIGMLTACGDFNYYIDLKIDNQDSLFFIKPIRGFNPQSNHTRRYIRSTEGSLEQQRTYITFIANSIEVGFYEGECHWFLPPKTWGDDSDHYKLPVEATNIEITQVEEGVVEGNFSGNHIIGPDNQVIESIVTGSFRVR